MKALICRQWGNPDTLTLESVPTPRPQKGEILIEVRAASVNFPDVLMVQGRYQNSPSLPFIPGMDVAGIVSSVGSDVSQYQQGNRVCAHLRYGGGFAEKVVAIVNHTISAIPESVSFEAGAAFPTTYGTSLHALKDRAQLRPAETVLVLGAAGGVGSAAIQLAKIMGAKVIACASSLEKRVFRKSSG